jgi:hypothetical protein
MSDDTPTQRFDAQPAPVGPTGDKPKSRLPLVLGIVGGVLLLVVILLLVLLLRGQGTPEAAGTNSPIASTSPSASPTPTTSVAAPSPTPSESHTTAPPPPPPPTGPAFTKFVKQTSINSCSGGPYYTGAPPIIEVTWATVRTDSAWIIQGTDDAADAQFMQIPVSGNQSNFPYELDFACGSPSSTYTITIVGSNGKHLSKSWTIKNTSPGP